MSETQLHLGDCLEVMKGIPDKSIDMILCDLPYGTTQNKGQAHRFKSSVERVQAYY